MTGQPDVATPQPSNEARDFDLARISPADFSNAVGKISSGAGPAVIEGLLDGQFLSTLSDIDAARARIGNTPVVLRRNYTDSHLTNIQNFVQGAKSKIAIERRQASFTEYLDLVREQPDTRWLITEQPTPALLLEQTSLRAINIERLEGGYGQPFSTFSPNVAHSLMFMANQGNTSNLHTDWDGRDVLLYQLFGRKRVVLFPPEAAPKLHPIDIFSTLPLNGMDDKERRALLAYAGGREHVLQPGEAILIPAFWWHHIDYLDPSMSVNFRFGGVEDADALALARTMHRDYHIQNIIAGTRDPARADACRHAAKRLLQAARQPYRTPRAKFRFLKNLALECHEDIASNGPLYARPFMTAEMLLEGALCDVYGQVARPGTSVRARLTRMKNTSLAFIRRQGRKISYLV